jgi:hypothetical protein
MGQPVAEATETRDVTYRRLTRIVANDPNCDI